MTTPGAVAPQVPASVLEEGDEIQAAQIQAAVASAALSLTQAGIYEGRMHIPVGEALEAAATIYQAVYGRVAMRRTMQMAAAKVGVADAYAELVKRPKK